MHDRSSWDCYKRLRRQLPPTLGRLKSHPGRLPTGVVLNSDTHLIRDISRGYTLPVGVCTLLAGVYTLLVEVCAFSRRDCAFGAPARDRCHWLQGPRAALCQWRHPIPVTRTKPRGPQYQQASNTSLLPHHHCHITTAISPLPRHCCHVTAATSPPPRHHCHITIAT